MNRYFFKPIFTKMVKCSLFGCAALAASFSNAYVTSDMGNSSIIWSFLDIQKKDMSRNISYPVCYPEDKVGTEAGRIFLEELNAVADLWNQHAKSAIGNEWPIDQVAFHTNISRNDCNRQKFLHESGATVKPLQIHVKPSGLFDAGNHRLRPNEHHFSQIKNVRNIFLHEYGHVMGLADDYKGSSIQGGRPPSMMKMHITLQEEDKFALKHVWEHRGNYSNAKCPDTHFTIDEGYRGIYWAAGSKSCLPYLKDNIVNNPDLAKYNISNPDNCIIFLEDSNADIGKFGGNVGQQERYREQNPEEYFTGAPIYSPICLESDNSGNLEPLSVFLNVDDMRKADSLWVGNNVHVNVRMLQKQNNGRYLTVKEDHVYYPFAWYHSQWISFDLDEGRELPLDVDGLSVNIIDRKKEMIEPNIPPLNLNRSAELNPTSWLDSGALQKALNHRLGSSCASLDIQESGTYLISRDALSDQHVYCEVNEQERWTYIGHAHDMSIFKPFFHLNRGIPQVDDPSHENSTWDQDGHGGFVMDHQRTRSYHGNNSGSYTNGLPSKLNDDEMLIKVDDYYHGPKVYLKYDENIAFFNDKYHRICEDDNTYDVQLKIDWPDSDRASWNNNELWPDNVYHDAQIKCEDRSPLSQQVNLIYTNKNLGDNGDAVSFRLNLAYGIKLHNDEWNIDNPIQDPVEPWRAAKKNRQSWIYVRNSSESPLPSPTPGMLPTGTYRIVAKHSGKVLDVAGYSKTRSGNIHQWTWHGDKNQIWNVRHDASGNYEIQSQHSDMFLDLAGGRLSNSTNIQQWPYVEGNLNQKWILEAAEQGYFQIKSVRSGKCLDVAGGTGATNNGRNIQQYTCANVDNQKFKFERLGAPPAEPTLYEQAWSQGGCQEHFANIIRREVDQTVESCATACKETRSCTMFSIGRMEPSTQRSGWCNLYTNLCTNNHDQTWDTFRIIR